MSAVPMCQSVNPSNASASMSVQVGAYAVNVHIYVNELDSAEVMDIGGAAQLLADLATDIELKLFDLADEAV